MWLKADHRWFLTFYANNTKTHISASSFDFYSYTQRAVTNSFSKSINCKCNLPKPNVSPLSTMQTHVHFLQIASFRDCQILPFLSEIPVLFINDSPLTFHLFHQLEIIVLQFSTENVLSSTSKTFAMSFITSLGVKECSPAVSLESSENLQISSSKI